MPLLKICTVLCLLKNKKKCTIIYVFLISQNSKSRASSPEQSYHKGFFNLFGSNKDFANEAVDLKPELDEEELF